MQQAKPHYLVVGMGLSGYATIRYLLGCGYDVTACDTREQPPYAKRIQQEFPHVPQISGIPYSLFVEFKEVIVSPGVKIEDGYKVLGDIELFARHANAPVIAITGSNGKSTVTMLVERLLHAGGYHCLVGGNIGTPALDLLARTKPDFYVLELSSFQLETTYSLQPEAATVLNLSADHLDRYDTIEQYQEAKMRIYNGAKGCVINREQNEIYALKAGNNIFSFGLDEPVSDCDFGLRVEGGETFFAHGEQNLIAVSDLTLAGRHNQLNMLAACALIAAAGVEITEKMLKTASQYAGLEHRCEMVVRKNGVAWINDSKGTNVGATCAALDGFNSPVVLIAGGVGKGADFAPLAEAMLNKVTHAILFGEDASKIAEIVPKGTISIGVNDLAAAVGKAQQVSHPGATVLFSPACASFDMFRDYEHRGYIFKDLVAEIVVNNEVQV